MAHEDKKEVVKVNREPRDKQLSSSRISLRDQKYSTLDYFGKDPNFHYRWVNDKYGRIPAFLRAGWQIVEGNTDDTYSGAGHNKIEGQRNGQLWRSVNSQIDATSKDAVLMKIPKELFEEDQKAKEQYNHEQIHKVDEHGLIAKAMKMGISGVKPLK